MQGFLTKRKASQMNMLKKQESNFKKKMSLPSMGSLQDPSEGSPSKLTPSVMKQSSGNMSAARDESELLLNDKPLKSPYTSQANKFKLESISIVSEKNESLESGSPTKLETFHKKVVKDLPKVSVSCTMQRMIKPSFEVRRQQALDQKAQQQSSKVTRVKVELDARESRFSGRIEKIKKNKTFKAVMKHWFTLMGAFFVVTALDKLRISKYIIIFRKKN